VSSLGPALPALKPTTDVPSSASSEPDVRSPGVRLALVLLRGYKVLISPYFRGSCRFLPSCADYAATAIATHGVAKGSWLALRRLSRCHPLAKAGYDPVPAHPGLDEGAHL
jgi:putative membrane protein insertion efficiency factor